MSNAKYRNHIPFPHVALQVATRAASIELEAPGTQTLLQHAKRLLGVLLERAEQSLTKGDGAVPIRDALNATKQVIAIARIEQRALERAAREAREAARVPTAAATPPAVVQPAPDMHAQAAAFAKATADNPTDPVPILLTAPPPDVRDAG